MEVDEALNLDEEGVRLWKELPSTVLCHILQQIPYKRADCTGLTKLALQDNELLDQLPAGISQLTALQVLDVSGAASLRSLGPGFASLTCLTELNFALQAMRVLDVGRCSSLWRLPSSLLRLSLLQRLVVPSKAIAQHVCEQLECRAQLVQVDMEPGDDCSDGDDWDLPPLLDHESDGNESDDLI
ncbi:hypothetical protein OEZ86_006667 [Tetradesmus obliquus]|nr:hypothetical protein OEZ86_006667 [Tetradesmus obliquus]